MGPSGARLQAHRSSAVLSPSMRSTDQRPPPPRLRLLPPPLRWPPEVSVLAQDESLNRDSPCCGGSRRYPPKATRSCDYGPNKFYPVHHCEKRVEAAVTTAAPSTPGTCWINRHRNPSTRPSDVFPDKNTYIGRPTYNRFLVRRHLLPAVVGFRDKDEDTHTGHVSMSLSAIHQKDSSVAAAGWPLRMKLRSAEKCKSQRGPRPTRCLSPTLCRIYVLKFSVLNRRSF